MGRRLRAGGHPVEHAASAEASGGHAAETRTGSCARASRARSCVGIAAPLCRRRGAGGAGGAAGRTLGAVRAAAGRSSRAQLRGWGNFFMFRMRQPRPGLRAL
jgi:hypothetical protein